MKILTEKDKNLVFDEYIRCNLSNPNSGNDRHCSADIIASSASFEKCICVPLNVYTFTKKFFFQDKELGACICPAFGSSSEIQKAGYTVCDAVNLKGKSKSISNLTIEMGVSPVYNDLKRIYAMLLCAYLGEIINQYSIYLEFPDCTAFSTMIDKIEKAYSGINQEADELLCKIYFYICVCIRGNDTFTPYRLCSFLGGIFDYSKSIANDILQDLTVVLDGIRNGEKYIDILNRCPSNYLAGVCVLLNVIYDKLNKNCNFYPILEHFKTAFLCSKTLSPFEISNLIQNLKTHITN